MKAIRTYTKGKEISYQFPSTNKRWTVQFSDNIESISFVGQNNTSDAANQIQEVQTLNANLTSLNDYCLNQTENLIEVYLSPQLKSIAERCFNECTGVKAISYDIYETGIADIEEELPQLEHVGDYAFSRCDNIRSITIPESINSISQIDSLAFAGSNLTSVTFLGITSNQLLGS